MYLVGVIPISRGTGVKELSYYSAVEYPVGSFLTVSVRGKEKNALVVSSEKVRNVKASLRKSSFALQKIRRQKARQIITQEFVRAAEKIARCHATTVSAVLFATIPTALLEQKDALRESFVTSKPKLRGYVVPRLYQGLSKDRVEFYRTSIRETFAAKGSVYIVTPSVVDAERVYAELKGGIEQYMYIVHGKLTKKEQKDRVANLLKNEHPVCIVLTYQFLSLPRHDLATIIVEREASPLYRARVRPFIDARILAHELAAQLGGQLFLADLPLRIESVYRREIGEYEEVVSGHHRMHFKTRAQLCNMQNSLASTPQKEFRVLSQDLVDRIREKGAHGGRTFLYVARRGLSPVTLCRDCGTVVTCNECGASVVLHKGSEENYFLCHSCGALRHARERCVNCKSWRLEAFGIGTELVEHEVKKLFPKRDVLVLSSDAAKSYATTKKILGDFYNKPRSILIGTEMALPHLTRHVPLVGVVSLDSLLSLASWNIYERIAGILTRLREIAGEDLVLQTRRPEADILNSILAGNFSGFYKSELKMRKNLGYPPYTVIIKLSITGDHDEVHKKMEEATAFLAPFELVAFSRVLKAPGGKHTMHGFIRVARENWPQEELLQKLRAFPPSYVISVDPDSIL